MRRVLRSNASYESGGSPRELTGKLTMLTAAVLAGAGALLLPAAASAANEAAPWSAPDYISPAGLPAEGPSLSLLSDGGLVATWSQDTDDGWFPDLASQPYTKAWSDPEHISSSAISPPEDPIGGVRTAVTGDGRFVSTWLAPSSAGGFDVDGTVGEVKPGDSPSESAHTFAANTADGAYTYGGVTPQVVMSSTGTGTVEYTAASKTPSGGTYIGLTALNGGKPGAKSGLDANFEYNPGPYSQTDYTALNPSLAAGPLNKAWDDSATNRNALVFSTPDGATLAQVFSTSDPSDWGAVKPQKPTALSAEVASVGVLSDGSAIVAQNYNELTVWESGHGDPQVADSESTLGYPSIATDSDGGATIAYLAYDDQDNTDTVKEVTVSPDGKISDPVSLSADGLTVTGLTTAYGPDGTTYVVWSQSDPSDAADDGIYATVRLPDGSFPKAPQAVFSGSYAIDPKVAIDQGGFATIVAEVYDSADDSYRIASFTHATPLPPVNVTAPTIQPSHESKVGAKLSCSPGRWVNGPTNYRYEWLRNSTAIKSATKQKYTVTHADAGDHLICRVTASNSNGSGQAKSKSLTVRK